MSEIKDHLPGILDKIKEQKELDAKLVKKGPKRLDEQWNSLAVGQFKPISSNIADIAPLNPDVSDVIEL